MAFMSDLDPGTRAFLDVYQWQRIDPVPWAVPSAAPGDLQVGLVAMACMKMPDQPHFVGLETGGDPTPRIVSADVDPARLVNDFPGQNFDHAGLAADANLLVPIDRMHELAEAGVIGGIAPRVVSMCGHITKTRRLIDETAPAIARLFADDDAGAVLLVPA